MTPSSDTASPITADGATRNFGWLILAGIGLAFCLMLNGAFDTMMINQFNFASFPLRITDDPLSGGIGVIAMCLIIVIVIGLGWRPKLGPVFLTVLGVFLVIPLVFLYLAVREVFPSIVGEISGLVLSASAIFLTACWAEILARQGRRWSIIALVIALVADTLIDIIASQALVEGAIIGLVFIAAVTSPILLYVFKHQAESWHERDGITATIMPSSRHSPYRSMLILSIVCIALYGLVMGRVQSIGSIIEDPSSFATFILDHVTNIGALITAALIFALMHLRNPHTVTRIFILVFLLLALYLSGIFGAALEPGGMVMMTVARFAIVAYIWLLTCDRATSHGYPMAILALGWGVFTLTDTLSTKFGLYVFTDGAGYAVYTVIIVLCLIALIVLEFMSRRYITIEEASVLGANASDDPAAFAANANSVSDAEAAEDPLVQRCRILAEHYGLTARELEVLVPLVRGRSAASIAASLNMSTETARTHIRHIYQKTDIHNREELMDEVTGSTKADA